MANTMKRRLLLIIFAIFASIPISYAQQYTALEGLLHCPSADMHERGTGRVALSWLNKEFLPASYDTDCLAYSFAYSPFKWAELSFTGLVRKPGGIVYQDRMASVKFRLLAENDGSWWWPSVAVGCNDPLSTLKTSEEDESNNRMCNFFLAISKHYEVAGKLGLHVSYRRFRKLSNNKWNGAVGGISWQPYFLPVLRLICEYDGAGINLGADAKLFKHLYLQAMSNRFKSFDCGLCFEFTL